MNRRPAPFLSLAIALCAWLVVSAPAQALVQTADAVARETLLDALAPLAERGATITVTIAAPDPRQTIANCRQLSGFIPPGARLVGKTVVGIRCVDGASGQILVGADVRIDAPVWQATRALRAGDALAAGDVMLGTAVLSQADVDAAASSGRPSARGLATLDGRSPAPFGRTVQRPMGIGHALAVADLREDGRVNAGESVRVVYLGAGFTVSSEGRTVGPADPGSNVQIRLASGAVINGTLRADRQVEVAH